MFFRKKLPRSCSYCLCGTKLDDHQILCTKNGIVADSFACRKFVYDPYKRVPPKMKALDLDKYHKEDFSL